MIIRKRHKYIRRLSNPVAIKRKIYIYTRLIPWLLGFGIMGPVIAYAILTKYSILKPADLGGFFSGTTGLFLTLASILFIYVAFLNQLVQLVYQRKEIKLNKRELALTRKELEGQKNQFVEQNKLLSAQRFEATFFTLVATYQSFLSNYKFTDSTGLPALREFYNIYERDPSTRDNLLRSCTNFFSTFYSILMYLDKIPEGLEQDVYVKILISQTSETERKCIEALITQSYFSPYYREPTRNLLIKFNAVDPNTLKFQ